MSAETSAFKALLDRAESWLESSSARLLLSALIIVSVLPESVHRAALPELISSRLNYFFLAVFGTEFALRTVLYARRWRERRAGAWEVVLLALDLVAVFSFLPKSLLGDAQALRLPRLTRLLLLFGYWGNTGRDLFEVISRRERGYQVGMVLFLGLVLSFGSAVLIAEFDPNHDFDDDGQLSSQDHRFFRVLWWSFRQVQDPGNLVAKPENGLIVGVSLLLTLFGLLLFSFIVGIGTSVVEELLTRSRAQPLGMRQHTVILGFTPGSLFLLRGLAEIYRKNLRPFPAAVLGPDERTPDELHGPLLRRFRYRQGDPVDTEDLDRVDVGAAKRVIALGTEKRDPDAGVISAILAVRERHPGVDLYPDMEHERNFRAARAAGGPRTHIVGSGSFLGYYLVQNLVYPGIQRLYRQLLTSEGCEIYTYVFPEDERQLLLERAGEAVFDPAALYRRAYLEEGVSFFGLFVAEEAEPELEVEDLEVVLDPVWAARRAEAGPIYDGRGGIRWAAVRGLVAVALRWEDLCHLAREVVADPLGLTKRVRDVEMAEPGLGRVRLTLSRGPIEKLLISGASPRVPRIVTELLGFYPRLTIAVVLRDRSRLEPLMRDLRAMLAENWGESETFEAAMGAGLRLAARGRRLEVHLIVGEWIDRRFLENASPVTLETADALLLLPEGQRGESLDGAVALDALHLANLERSGEVHLQEEMRLVGMMADPVKVDLLSSRLEKVLGTEAGPKATILSGERARHHFLMQNVFVKGLNSILLELLSPAGQHLGRLVPGPDCDLGAGFDPWRLALHLLEERQLMLVGVELEGEDGALEVQLDPRELAPGREIEGSRVRAIYVLGEWRDFVELG